MGKIKRSLLKSFLNTDPTKTGGQEKWALINKGVTSQKFQYNPETTTETYIGEDSATTSVDSYKVSVQTPMTAFKGDPIFEYVDALRKKRAVGEDCETQLLVVNAYDKQTDGSFSAELNQVTIQITEFGADGGKPLEAPFTIALNGDPVYGTVTFEANGAAKFKKATTAPGVGG
jgi:hypothetical protein|nr:MAG TPA: hypothetical protein [Caudoviricetes sp.]